MLFPPSSGHCIITQSTQALCQCLSLCLHSPGLVQGHHFLPEKGWCLCWAQRDSSCHNQSHWLQLGKEEWDIGQRQSGPRVPWTLLIRSPLPSIPRRSGSRAKGQGNWLLPDVVPRMDFDEWGANETRQMRRCLYHLRAEGCCCTRWAFSLHT